MTANPAFTVSTWVALALASAAFWLALAWLTRCPAVGLCALPAGWLAVLLLSARRVAA